MQYRTLGATGLEVSEIALGTWAFGGDEWGPADDTRSIRTIHQALDRGVNFLDTADVYGYGHSEEVIRQALTGRAESVYLCSKAGNDIYNMPRAAGGGPKDFSPAYLRQAVEGSRTRLGVDAIDLYLLHNPSLEVLRQGDALETLRRLKEEGVIRFYGASVYSAEEGKAAIDVGEVDALMITYNLIAQGPAHDLFPYARERGVGIIARSPLANGLLTGKYTDSATFPDDDHRAHRGADWLRKGVEKVDQYRFLTRGGSRPLAVAALAFILANRDVASVVVGAKSPEQIAENIQASASALSAEEREQIRSLETSVGAA
jgi:aryl-alcohol dehydrogenase-like predicted oxidoreductase